MTNFTFTKKIVLVSYGRIIEAGRKVNEDECDAAILLFAVSYFFV